MKLNVILVGSSPLPCYIQAAYALQEGPGMEKPDYILFVVTENTDGLNGTIKYAENIKAVLEKQQIAYESETLQITDGYNSYQIEEMVLKKIEEINQRETIEKILLNNTGGTKTMAVYATSGVRRFAQGRGVDVTECFVDPIENRIRCYQLGQNGSDLYPSYESGKTLKDYVVLDIKELIYLHYGTKVKISYSDVNGKGSDNGKEYISMTEEQKQFAIQILSDKKAYENYEVFYRICAEHSKGSLKRRADKMVSELERQGRLSLLSDLFSWTEGEYNFLPFMDGNWLELYFYIALLDAQKRLAKRNIAIQTVWSCKVTPEELYGKEFEVDILAIKGYELTLFSVSMADAVGLAKGKWFEAVYRTEQMAGEHGNVAVVNFLYDKNGNNNIEKFRSDLKTFKREVEIYNKSDMKDYDALVEKIELKFM